MEAASEHIGEGVDALSIAEDSGPSEALVGRPTVGLNNTTATTEGQNNTNNASKASGNVRNITFCRSIEIKDSDDRRLDYYKLDEFENIQDYQINNNTEPFEHVKVYKMAPRAYEQAKYTVSQAGTNPQHSGVKSRLYPSPGSIPEQYLRIFSTAIIHALRSIVTYYPAQDLSSDIIEIPRPYPVLVHHYDELVNFRDQHAGKNPAILCSREINATKDLELLLRFLDEQVMGEVKKEIEHNKNGLCTFNHMWLSLKPGTTFLCGTRLDTLDITGVVHSISGGSFVSPAEDWDMKYWLLEFDGAYLTRKRNPFFVAKFDGVEKINIILFDEKDIVEAMNKHPSVMEAVNVGKEYWELLNKQCRFHMGKAVPFPHNEVNGLVMIDLKSYHDEYLKAKNMESRFRYFYDDSDLKSWTSDCDCSVCIAKKDSSKTEAKFSANIYSKISKKVRQNLRNHLYFLCPKVIHAFVFKTRSWELLDINNLKEPNFDKDMINHLVMEPGLAETLKVLTRSYARVNIHGEILPPGLWVADFVEGKGSGLIFLLHGSPGVGKTFTAECIANFLGCPLMVLTTSDIGIEPKEVERNLANKFKTAKSWNALLLIDEADVYLAYRDVKDLKRSSLVASFLHALEYYDGILFLTTNRVGAFDDAVLSRVHVQLFYPELTHDQRTQIWMSFIKRLDGDTKHSMRVNSTAKEYIRGKEVADLSLNGREIKNAFQTAVALAEYQAIKDEDGKTLVTDDHIQSVLRLNKNFKNYIASIHQDSWAQRQWERPREE